MESRTRVPSESDELERLLQTMTLEQQLRFKQAVVRQAIHFVAKRLPPTNEDDGHRSCLRVATDWLNEPTEQKARDAATYAVSECWDGGARYDDYPRVFLEPVYAVAFDGWDSAQRAMYCVPQAEQEAARQWQIASAHAIGRDQEPLPLV
ncbi:MAG: hypothetical protein HC933_04140 [Pleurocapsa sp. SU_196_0]|nr:hypothetical protein [Pleurocapsa sp. SU_196_0]